MAYLIAVLIVAVPVSPSEHQCYGSSFTYAVLDVCGVASPPPPRPVKELAVNPA